MNQTVDEKVAENDEDEANVSTDDSSHESRSAFFAFCLCIWRCISYPFLLTYWSFRTCFNWCARECYCLGSCFLRSSSEGEDDENGDEESGNTHGNGDDDDEDEEESTEENEENFSHAFSMTDSTSKSKKRQNSSKFSSINSNNNSRRIDPSQSSSRKAKTRAKSQEQIQLEFIKHLREFNTELRQFGMSIRDVQRDGNCLFRAVSDQLEGIEGEHLHFRNLAVQTLKQKKEFFKHFVFDQEFDVYIEEMSENGTWGGNLEIQALSHALGHNFIIHVKGMPHLVIKGNSVPGIEKRTLHLAFHPENEGEEHYSSIRNINDDQDAPAAPIQHPKFKQLEYEINKADQNKENYDSQETESQEGEEDEAQEDGNNEEEGEEQEEEESDREERKDQLENRQSSNQQIRDKKQNRIEAEQRIGSEMENYDENSTQMSTKQSILIRQSKLTQENHDQESKNNLISEERMDVKSFDNNLILTAQNSKGVSEENDDLLNPAEASEKCTSCKNNGQQTHSTDCCSNQKISTETTSTLKDAPEVNPISSIGSKGNSKKKRAIVSPRSQNPIKREAIFI